MENTITHLTDSELLERTEDLARQEREVQAEFLQHLLEVERRRLYASRGFSSMHEYCVTRLRCSEGDAYQKIAAMRALRAAPEAEAALLKGEVTISSLSKLHGFVTRERKATGVLHDTRVLLKEIQGLSKRETERRLEEFATTPPPKGLREYRFLVSEDLEAILKELQAHTRSERIDERFLERIASLALKHVKREQALQERRRRRKATLPAMASTPAKGTRFISKSSRDGLGERKCSYKDPISGRACEARDHLEVDHVIPLALGGSNDPSNLRYLCRSHNQLTAIQQLGHETMAAYIPSLREPPRHPNTGCARSSN